MYTMATHGEIHGESYKAYRMKIIIISFRTGDIV